MHDYATSTARLSEMDERDDPIVLIYSREHRAYWRPNGLGYTTDRDSAGRWWLRGAKGAVAQTAHCGLEKAIEFHLAARWTRVIQFDLAPPT